MKKDGNAEKSKVHQCEECGGAVEYAGVGRYPKLCKRCLKKGARKVEDRHGRLKRETKVRAKAKPQARSAAPKPDHEHEWHGSKDGYRKCRTCGREEYQVKGEWVEAPVYRQPSSPKEPPVVAPPPTSCGRAYLDALEHAAKPKPPSPPPASPPETEGNYCIQCGIEILQRERCDECAKDPIPMNKTRMLCPSCHAPAEVEFKKGVVSVELAASCPRCGLLMSTIEMPSGH